MSRNSGSTGGLVYSTDGGRMCPACRKPIAQCVCKRQAAPAQPSDGVVRVSRESKGRGGNVVTVIKGLALEPPALEALGKQLRAACGTGGTVKDGAIELQGDHCDRAVALLQKDGRVVKRAGG